MLKNFFTPGSQPACSEMTLNPLTWLKKISALIFQNQNAVILYALIMPYYSLRSFELLRDIHIYPWTELFINYEGGFVRRGFLGELLYSVAHLVNAQLLAAIVYTIVVYYFFYLAYKLIHKALDPVCTYLVFMSPGIFFFYVKDVALFVRKDLFVMLAIFAMFAIARKAIGKPKSTVYSLTALFVFVYALALITHELALFLFPLAYIVLGIAYNENNDLKKWFCIGVLAELASLYLGIAYVGIADQQQAILASWQAIFPDFRPEHSAFVYIGQPFSIMIAEIKTVLSNPTIWKEIPLVMAIAFFPAAFIFINYRLFDTIQEVFSSRLLRRLVLPALLAPLLLLTFTTDFSRFISLAAMNAIFFFCTLQLIYPQDTPPIITGFCEMVKTSFPLQIGVFIFTYFYAFHWIVLHTATLKGVLVQRIVL